MWNVLRGFAVAGLSLAVAGTVLAEDRADQRSARSVDKHDTRTSQPGPSAPSQLLMANRLIGMDVKNARGEDLGQIEEIILDESQDRVQYVVLSFGGWLNVGDKLFAVPFQAFDFRQLAAKDRNAVAILDVSKERLRNAPGFDPDRYPDVADPQFARNVEQFYRRDDQRDGRAYRGAAGGENWSQDWEQWRLRALTKVIGSDVEDPDEWNIGDVEDLVIDAREGRLVYAIVSYGGALGIHPNEAIIPWRVLSPQIEDGQYTLGMPKDQAEKVLASLPYSDNTNLNDPQFARRIHQQFDADPYWEIYGYSAVTTSPATGWGKDEAFARAYNAKDERTLTGRIESVGTFYPASQAAPGLRLRLRTDDGKRVTVYGGPQLQARNENIRFYAGDQVTVVGSTGKLGDRSRFIARQIRSGDQTLTIFSEDGRPQWDTQALPRQQTQYYLYHGRTRVDDDAMNDVRRDSSRRYDSQRERRYDDARSGRDDDAPSRGDSRYDARRYDSRYDSRRDDSRYESDRDDDRDTRYRLRGDRYSDQYDNDRD